MRLALRLEGLALFALGVAGYFLAGGDALLLVPLLLVPDLSMLGYLAGTRWGSVAYNCAHVFVVPAAIVAVGAGLGIALLLPLGPIWAAHIGIDRCLGYGLKYRDAPFRETLVQRV